MFAYLDAFDPDKEGIGTLKDAYRRGGLGDVALKRRLEEVLQAVLQPIRKRRQEFALDPDAVMRLVERGTTDACDVAARTLADVRATFGITRIDPARHV
ncbi:MAG: hypothetical protein WDN69_23070 [Aliidongia sp.]